MFDLTDIHCHVLPGVDDGARDMEQARAMLRFMYDEGIRNVIVTPHYHGGYMECDIDTIRKRFTEVKQLVRDDEYISRMMLFLGCEIYYYPSIIEWLEKGRVTSMAGSDYVLLEFGFTQDCREIFEAVTHVSNAGYLPIVAHVERYEKIAKKIANVEELIKRGAYIQVNAEAFNGRFRERRFANKLMKEHMVHFVATDAHGIRHRRPELAGAAQHIIKHYGEDYCRELFVENPALVVSNGYIPL